MTSRQRSTSNKSSKKTASRRSKRGKYHIGEYVYDGFGSLAKIKFIGECHKGPGIWFGIEFVDGTIGKHNGAIGGNRYFYGKDNRCDMIRVQKIRKKASKSNIPKSLNKPKP